MRFGPHKALTHMRLPRAGKCRNQIQNPTIDNKRVCPSQVPTGQTLTAGGVEVLTCSGPARSSRSRILSGDHRSRARLSTEDLSSNWEQPLQPNGRTAYTRPAAPRAGRPKPASWGQLTALTGHGDPALDAHPIELGHADWRAPFGVGRPGSLVTLNRPRILVLDEEIPLPANTGKRIRTMNLLLRLAPSFEIDLLVHASGAAEGDIATLRAQGVNVHIATSQVPRKGGVRFYAGVLASLCSSLPYSVYSHRHRAFASLLKSLLDEHDYDLVHCEWTPYAIYRTGGQIPWSVSGHNIESEVWARLAESRPRSPMRVFLELQARRMARFEKRVFSSIPCATAVSERDARRISSWGCHQVEVVPNGVDLESNPLLDPGLSETGCLVFVGSMDWRANQDGIRWYLDQVHPLLRTLPDYNLTIVGRNPPDWIKEAPRSSRQIVVTGEVSDVHPYIARSSVVIVPLRVGGGSRLKILEAFACGRPVVSTTIGAEGLDLEAGRHALLADTPADFAEAVRTLLIDQELSRRIVLAARELVEERYDWEPIADRQRRAWSEFIATAHQIHGE